MGSRRTRGPRRPCRRRRSRGRARGRRGRAALEQPQRITGDHNLVRAADRLRTRQALAVHVGAVGGAQILDCEPRRPSHQPTMATRDPLARQGQVVVVGPADRDLVLGEGQQPGRTALFGNRNPDHRSRPGALRRFSRCRSGTSNSPPMPERRWRRAALRPSPRAAGSAQDRARESDAEARGDPIDAALPLTPRRAWSNPPGEACAAHRVRRAASSACAWCSGSPCSASALRGPVARSDIR